MSDEAEECKCPPPGLPAYMGTFADLMALLMCFFVLLLAFSEMDVLKFKQIAGSMKFAFGVQNKIEVEDIPKGTSIIAMEFRPGRPDPTPIETLQQQSKQAVQAITNGKTDADSCVAQTLELVSSLDLVNQALARTQDISSRVTAATETQLSLGSTIDKNMQQMVEGLSLVAISYYALQLTDKAIKALALCFPSLNVPLWQGISLPLVVVLVAGLLFWLNRKVHRDHS